MESKFFFAKVKSINDAARTIDAAASTADLDRDNERILTSSFTANIDSFKANPVILATHQHRLSTGSSPVIGSAVPESIQIGANDVSFTMRFAETPLGEEYWKLYKDKHMRAFSIGFIPLEWKDEKDEQIGYVRTFTKIELLEISAVPVPSNRRALARAKGFFDSQDSKDVIADVVKDEFTKMHLFIEQKFDDLNSVIIAERGELGDGLLGDPLNLPASGGDEQKLSEQVNRIQESFRKVT